LSHREIYELLARALLRAGIQPEYTAGFHPKPRFSFGPPLKVGMESEEEFADVWLKEFVPTDELKNRLQRELIEGLTVKDAQIVPEDAPSLASSLTGAIYVIHTDAGDRRIRRAMEGAGTAQAAFVKRIEPQGDGSMKIEVRGALASLPPPDRIAADILGLSIDELKGIRIRKVKTYFGMEGMQSG